MKKLIFLLAFIFAFTAKVWSTPVTVGAHQIPNFNPSNIGSDKNLTVGVTLGSPTVTSAGAFGSWVGMHGFRITIVGVDYTVQSVDSASSLTLTTNYAESTNPAASAIWRKYIEVRIYASISFSPFGNCTATGAPCQIQAGTPGSGAWYKRFAASVVSAGGISTLYMPELSGIRALDATTDAAPNGTAKYTVGFYRASGGSLIQYFDCSGVRRLALQPATPTSWTQICAANSPVNPAPSRPLNFLSEDQINSRFPTCLGNNLDYFPATGNAKNCLTLSAEFAITGGILSLAAPATGYNRIQEEGVNLPQRATLNFIGSAFTAADEVGVRTNVTADADINALASNATNGFWAAGTNIARTLTGTANEIGVTNGNGTVGNPVFSLPSALTFTGKTITGGTYSAPTIQGGTHTAITSLGIRSTGSPFDLTLASTEVFTAGRMLTFILNDANRVATLGGNLTLAAAFTTSGANALTLTTTGPTNITLPTTGTVATLAGTESLSNKTLPLPRITTSILDSNGNELWDLTATASAVNQATLANAATGNNPIHGVAGNDANIGQNFTVKGTGAASEFNFAGPVNITGAAAASVNPVEVFESGDGTSRTTISPDGKVQTRAGNGATPSTDFITLGGLYHFDFTTVGNVGGGEDVLMTKTVTANVLGQDGDTIVVVATGQTANVAGNLTIRAKYAGTNIDARTANGVGAIANWRWVLEISRNGANVFCSSTIVIQNSGSDTTFHRWFNATASFAVTHSNSNVLQFTGESANAANNDITQTSFRVWKYSAP